MILKNIGPQMFICPHPGAIYSMFILLIVPSDTSVVVLIVLCFGAEFLCFLSLMYVFIFQLTSGN